MHCGRLQLMHSQTTVFWLGFVADILKLSCFGYLFTFLTAAKLAVIVNDHTMSENPWGSWEFKFSKPIKSESYFFSVETPKNNAYGQKALTSAQSQYRAFWLCTSVRLSMQGSNKAEHLSRKTQQMSEACQINCTLRRTLLMARMRLPHPACSVDIHPSSSRITLRRAWDTCYVALVRIRVSLLDVCRRLSAGSRDELPLLDHFRFRLVTWLSKSGCEWKLN